MKCSRISCRSLVSQLLVLTLTLASFPAWAGGDLIFEDGFESGDISSWGDPLASITRVGVVNALHDYWFESNLNAVQGIASLNYHAIKIWPTVSYLHPDLRALYEHPAIDVVALRPLQNSSIETGCSGDYWRWENIDYGTVAQSLYAEYGHLNKVIILTGWEGDHQLKGLGCSQVPPQAEIDAFISMLNARQSGVAAARAANPTANLRIYHAVEVNQVDSGTGFSVLNTVIPALASPPDMISYSAYGPGGQSANVQDRLEIIRTRSGLPRYRIYIGEFARDHNQAGTAQSISDFGSQVFEWGSSLLFMWVYRNEFPGSSFQDHSLVIGQWPNVVPTANHTGLSAVRTQYDNFIAPDIDVVDGFGTPVPVGSTAAIGTTPVGVATSKLFTISNTGNSELTITNSLQLVSGACFWLGLASPPSPIIEPGQATTFRVWYQCSTQGTHVGSVAIVSDDPNESVWSFTITGTSQ